MKKFIWLSMLLVLVLAACSEQQPNKQVDAQQSTKGIYAWHLAGSANPDKKCDVLDNNYADTGTEWT